MINPPSDVQFPHIQAALQAERVARYMGPGGGDIQRAFQFYLWNCELAEAFQTPLHFAEVCARNAFNRALVFHFGSEWWLNQTFRVIADAGVLRLLDEKVDDELKQHGAGMTHHHVASALAFGFWEHLVTKRFDRTLWKRGVRHNFPNANYNTTREDLYKLIHSVRLWRNRVMHYHALFDKGPTKKHQDALQLIGWVCRHTESYTASISRVPAVIAARPSEPTRAPPQPSGAEAASDPI